MSNNCVLKKKKNKTPLINSFPFNYYFFSRLARNRASARERRMRKKTHTESLEVVVTQLELGIQKLREANLKRDDLAAVVNQIGLFFIYLNVK